ncbi:MAG: ATP-binding protein [Desulfovermiculus sp.]
MTEDQLQGLVLMAEPSGEVNEVIFDDIRCTLPLSEQMTLFDILDRHSHAKLQRFIEQTQTKGVALSWELDVNSPDGPLVMQFFAIMRKGQMLVIASSSPQNIFRLYDELISIVNEQSQLVRTLHKEKDELTRLTGIGQTRKGDAGLLHEFMQMNNELINAQRELTRMNEQLERQKARFRKLIYQNIDGLLVVDGNRIIHFANPRAESMLGLGSEDLVGQPFAYMLQTDAVQELEIPRNNGSQFLEIRSTSIEWENSPAVLVSLRDVTARRQAEQLRDDVERITRHDLKTPLNAVIGMPQLIRANNQISGEDLEYLTYIEEAGYRMLHMINRSLDLYKMEQGLYEFQQQPVEITRIIRRILIDTQALSTRKSIRSALSIQGKEAGSKDGFWVLGEKLLCHSMLENLIINALEAAPEETEVQIDLVREDLAAIVIHNQGKVPDHILPRFFDKYSTDGKSHGTGLGTYSARLMAQSQGGSISMHTSEEEGTTLIVRLPAPENENRKPPGGRLPAHRI